MSHVIGGVMTPPYALIDYRTISKQISTKSPAQAAAGFFRRRFCYSSFGSNNVVISISGAQSIMG